MAKKSVVIHSNQQQVDLNVARLGEIDAEIARLEAEMNGELIDVRRGFAAEFNTLNDERARIEEGVLEYERANADELFATKATFKLTHGDLKMTKGKPSIDFAGDSITEDLAVERIKAAGEEAAARYIRVQEYVRREAILAALDTGDLTAADIRAWGLVRKQETTFKVIPKRESASDAIKGAGAEKEPAARDTKAAG